MSRRRRIRIISAVALVVVLCVPVAGALWLCYTEAGLRWLVARAENLRNVQMRFTGVQGSLAGPITIERFELTHARVHVVASRVRTELDLRAAMLQTIQARNLAVESVDVGLRKRTEPPVQRAPRFLPAWLRVRVARAQVGRARVVLTNGRVIDARPLSTSVSITSRELSLRDARVESAPYDLAGSLDVIASSPAGLEGDLAWRARFPEQPEYAGRVKLAGDLDALRIDGSVVRPFAVALAGTAHSLTGDWNWQARTQADAMDLKPWQPRSTLGRFAAALQGKGNREGLAVSGVVTPADVPSGPLEVSVEGAFEGKRLRADSLVLRLARPRSELRAHGTITFDGGPPTMHLDGQWSELRFPLEGAPRVTSRSGAFSLRGGMPYTYSLDGDFRAPRDIAGRVAAQGEFDRASVTARSFTLQALGGTMQGDGNLSWANDKPWRASIVGRDFNPATLYENFPGQLGFELAGSGRGFDARGQWRLDLRSLRGTLRGQRLGGRASVERDHDTFRIRDTVLRHGSARLAVQGVHGPTRDLHVELTARDLSRLVPQAWGSLELRGDLKGTQRDPVLTLALQARDLQYELGERKLSVTGLEASGNLDLSDRQASSLRVTANDLSVDARRLESVVLSVDGRASAQEVTLRADAGNAQMELGIHGAYARRQWAGTIERLAVTVGESKLALVSPARFLVSPERAQLAQLCLANGGSKLCSQGAWQAKGPWTVQANASDVPLRLLAAGLPRAAEYSGLLALDVRADGEPTRPFTGHAVLDFKDGVYRYRRAGGKVESISLGTGRARAQATAQEFTLDADLKAGERGALDASVRAQRLPDARWQSFPLRGSARARTTELGFVPLVLPEVDRASGELSADLQVAGTLAAPRFEGTVTLERGEMDLYAINLLLREMNARLGLSDNTLKLSGGARAGKGTAAVEGELAWQEGKPRGTLKLTGENLELLNVPEAHVTASPNLRFRMDGRRIDVDGAVRIPSARLAPADLTGAALPSEDEIIVGEAQTPPENRFYVTTGVHGILGKDVQIDSYGLTGRLTGGVLMYSATGEVSTGIGEILIEDGKYELYTREFEIERGRLVFSGGPLGDPGVDLRAVKRMPDLVAGVNVRGTLRQPRLSFFSDPPLTQNQIASLLLTGRSLDALQDEGTTNAGQGREQLLAQGGAMIAGRLGEQLGIKDLTVGTDSENPASLVLGTYLSPRLYVSYGISLAESINTFKLRYTLGDRWTLKTEAGENSSADIVYTIER